MPKRLANRFDRLKCHRQLLLCCGFLLLSGWGDRPVVAQSLSPADQLKADRLAQAIYRRPRDGAEPGVGSVHVDECAPGAERAGTAGDAARGGAADGGARRDPDAVPSAELLG